MDVIIKVEMTTGSSVCYEAGTGHCFVFFVKIPNFTTGRARLIRTRLIRSST